MKSKHNKNFIVGAALVVIGVLFLLLQLANQYQESFVLLIIGVVFLVIYFIQRKYGWLIPACLLLGLGLGNVVEESLTWLGDTDAVGLGLGFIAIYILGHFLEEKSHWWPLVPGIILLFAGLSEGSKAVTYIWPVILIIIGVLILVRHLQQNRNSASISTPPEKK